jgi:hypothetical protein
LASALLCAPRVRRPARHAAPSGRPARHAAPSAARPSGRRGCSTRRGSSSSTVRRRRSIFLGDDELDKRRGVEVEDRRRCYATSSDTDSLALTFARRSVRGPVGGVTRPRLTKSSSGSTAPTPDNRAIDWPGRAMWRSSARRSHGKEGVKGSNPFVGSRFLTATSP